LYALKLGTCCNRYGIVGVGFRETLESDAEALRLRGYMGSLGRLRGWGATAEEAKEAYF
jgi:hypothetical protein